MPHAPAAAYSFYHTLFQQVLDSRFENVRYGLFAVNEINSQEILGGERGGPFLPDLFKEAEEFGVLDLAVKSQPDGMIVRVCEIRQRFALPDALAIDEIKSLPRTLDQSALAENLRDAAIAWVLLPKNVFTGDTRRKSAWTDDLDSPGELTHEHRSAAPIVAMTDGVQNGFADCPLVEGGHVPDEEPLLEMLKVIAKIDQLPKLIEHGEKSPAGTRAGQRPGRAPRWSGIRKRSRPGPDAGPKPHAYRTESERRR